MALAKHVAHVEEMREKVTKEKIRRTLQLERNLQHKIEEFDLGPESLVLVFSYRNVGRQKDETKVSRTYSSCENITNGYLLDL